MRFKTAFIALIAACFAIAGTLAAPEAPADEYDKKTIVTLHPPGLSRSDEPDNGPTETTDVAPVASDQEELAAVTALDQDGNAQPQLPTVDSSASELLQTGSVLPSIAVGGLLGLAGAFGLRRFSVSVDKHQR